MNPSKYLSVTETARLLGVRRQTVLSLVHRHKLEAIKIGTTWAVLHKDVETRIARRNADIAVETAGGTKFGTFKSLTLPVKIHWTD